MSSFKVQLVTPSGALIDLKGGSTILGRGPRFSIQDRRVSRRQAELNVSEETNTVTLMSVC